MLRNKLVLAASVVALGACGGGDKTAANGAAKPDTTAAAPAATAAAPAAGGAATAGAAAAAPITGKTVEVKMIGDAQGYRFDPASITVKVGDGIKFTNVTGGPHNVTFSADSIPAGTAAQLGANMPNTTSPLTGPLLINANDSYTVSFAGLKAGTYHFYCTPHLALGMKGVVTVQ
jgi:plastocyanin